MDRDPLTCAIPARIHQITIRTGCFHPLHQYFTVLCRMQRQEGFPKARREGGGWFGNSALRTRQFGSKASQEMILRLIMRQFGYRWQYAKRICGQEDHFLRRAGFRHRFNDIFNVVDRIRDARIFSDRIVIKIDITFRINGDIFQ